MLKKKILSVLLASALGMTVLTGCQSTTGSGATGQERKQLLVVSESEVNREAAAAYKDLMNQAKAARALNTNKNYVNRVNKISKNLINQVSVFRSDAKNWNWEVNVINSPTVNAFCMAGGKIAVFTGIIDQLKLTDDELAAIIGHEIGHALREHTREQMSQSQASGTLVNIIGKVAGASDKQMKLAETSRQALLMMPFSREMESEADIIGLELMARAGYNPNAAVEVWRKMNKLEAASGGSNSSGNAFAGVLSAVATGGSTEDVVTNLLQTGNIMSTHPTNNARIKNLENNISKVMPLYEAAKSSKPTARGKKGKKK